MIFTPEIWALRTWGRVATDYCSHHLRKIGTSKTAKKNLEVFDFWHRSLYFPETLSPLGGAL